MSSPRLSSLPLWQRRTIYGVGLATWLTGGVWLVYKYFVRVVDEFGFENPHPQQRLWLIAHAAASLIAVWLFGLLWHHHIARGWENRLRRGTGGTLFGVIAWLALSGCALYYIGSDNARNLVSLAHWIVGLAAIGAYLLHDRRS
jgi:hypothetical protein